MCQDQCPHSVFISKVPRKLMLMLLMVMQTVASQAVVAVFTVFGKSSASHCFALLKLNDIHQLLFELRLQFSLAHGRHKLMDSD